MDSKIKIVFLYQVIMHYRLPFYERISEDERFDFSIFHGRGKAGTKLVNSEVPVSIKSSELWDFRVPFNTGNGNGTMPFTPGLLFKLISSSPSIIFSEGSSSLFNSSIAFIYAKIFRRKFIWWSLGMLKDREYSGIRKIINKWEKIIERNCDAIFTYSTQGKNYFLSRGCNKEKIFVGVNVLDTVRKLEEINEYKHIKINFEFRQYFNLSFIGSITKEKNIEVLVDVLGKFNEKYNNAGSLHIIGDGNHLLKLREYVKFKELEGMVIFHGRINRGGSAILQHCDLMVLPGLGGLAICEAMLNSLPIITGRADGTELDLVDESNGFVIPQLNEEILLKKIEFFFNNPLRRKEMGSNSFQKITKKFSIENYYGKFLDAVSFVQKR